MGLRGLFWGEIYLLHLTVINTVNLEPITRLLLLTYSIRHLRGANPF